MFIILLLIILYSCTTIIYKTILINVSPENVNKKGILEKVLMQRIRVHIMYVSFQIRLVWTCSVSIP